MKFVLIFQILIFTSVFSKRKSNRPKRVCEDFGCSHACQLNEYNRPICLCPKGMDLVGSRIKCKKVTDCQTSKLCTCKGGHPLPHTECSRNGAHECLYCDGAFHVDDHTKKCVANQCKCSNGYAVPDSNCTYNDFEQCKSCFRSGFHLENGQCLENQCFCENGIPDSAPASNEACGKHWTNECFRCNIGFMIGGENDEFCVKTKNKYFKRKGRRYK